MERYLSKQSPSPRRATLKRLVTRLSLGDGMARGALRRVPMIRLQLKREEGDGYRGYSGESGLGSVPSSGNCFVGAPHEASPGTMNRLIW